MIQHVQHVSDLTQIAQRTLTSLSTWCSMLKVNMTSRILCWKACFRRQAHVTARRVTSERGAPAVPHPKAAATPAAQAVAAAVTTRRKKEEGKEIQERQEREEVEERR